MDGILSPVRQWSDKQVFFGNDWDFSNAYHARHRIHATRVHHQDVFRNTPYSRLVD